jgi:geranylgeranyl diphosphate synthase type I
VGSGVLDAVRSTLDPVLWTFLHDRRAELAAMDPAAATLVDELERVIRAGGKRVRPALCYWAYRAAGGADGEPIARACSAVELVHTSAIVHDDVMDRTSERRGQPATHVRFAEQAPSGVDPEGFGISAAILVGDLALALSDRAMRESGFAENVLRVALVRFDRMRLEMAAGQFLDISGSPDRDRVAALKSSSYTAEGPVLVGAALAGAGAGPEGSLRAYAGLLGQAFQLRDDVLDAEAPPEAARSVDRLLGEAVAELAGSALEAEARAALAEIAGGLRLAEAG